MVALEATEKLKKLIMQKRIKIKPKEDGEETVFHIIASIHSRHPGRRAPKNINRNNLEVFPQKYVHEKQQDCSLGRGSSTKSQRS